MGFYFQFVNYTFDTSTKYYAHFSFSFCPHFCFHLFHTRPISRPVILTFQHVSLKSFLNGRQHFTIRPFSIFSNKTVSSIMPFNLAGRTPHQNSSITDTNSHSFGRRPMITQWQSVYPLASTHAQARTHARTHAHKRSPPTTSPAGYIYNRQFRDERGDVGNERCSPFISGIPGN